MSIIATAPVPDALRLSALDTAEIPRIVFPCPNRSPEQLAAEVERLDRLGLTLIEISDFLGITPDQAMTWGATLRTTADALAWHLSLPPLSEADIRATASKWAAMTAAEIAAEFGISEAGARRVRAASVEALAELDGDDR